MRTASALAALALGLAAPAYAGAPASRSSPGPREAAAMDEARGTFEVRLEPVSAPGEAVTRMSLDKTWTGDVEGTSTGAMLSSGSPATGNAGYVALERVSGSLKGRRGGFALQHSGVLDGGKPSLTVTVVPGSGTEALAGLSGEMSIDPADHSYVLRYRLPAAPAP